MFLDLSEAPKNCKAVGTEVADLLNQMIGPVPAANATVPEEMAFPTDMVMDFPIVEPQEEIEFTQW